VKYLVLAVLLFIAGVALTQLNVEDEAFLPVVRVRTEGGAFITIVHNRRSAKRSCQETVKRLVVNLRACPDCAIESQGCATNLTGLEKALADGKPLPVYSVSAIDVRVSIIGPPAYVRADCEGLARQIALAGVPSVCIHPEVGTPPSVDRAAPPRS
jgi:hypothetical protein